MRFLDNLSKTLSSGVDRAKFEADKFQRTSKVNGEISNLKAQIETNTRQLGERALELYQQGMLTAPEIASLAQIIGQLRDQQSSKERELEQVTAETFEQFQASQPQTQSQDVTPPVMNQSVPISSEGGETSGGGGQSFPTPTSSVSRAYPMPSNDMSGTGMPNASSSGGVDAVGSTPYACANCGYAIPDGAVFCPNCGTRSVQP